MNVRGIHHPSLNVTDLSSAVAFWTDTVGAEVVQLIDPVTGAAAQSLTGHEGVAAGMAVLRVGDTFVEILEYRRPASRRVDRELADLGWSHVCLEVDDVIKAASDFSSAGCRLRSEPIDMGDGIACYLTDPWGNDLELWEIREQALRLHRKRRS